MTHQVIAYKTNRPAGDGHATITGLPLHSEHTLRPNKNVDKAYFPKALGTIDQIYCNRVGIWANVASAGYRLLRHNEKRFRITWIPNYLIKRIINLQFLRFECKRIWKIYYKLIIIINAKLQGCEG